MRVIVEHESLLSLFVAELSSEGTVPYANNRGVGDVESGIVDERDSRVGHRGIGQFLVSLLLVFSVGAEVGVPHEHVFSRHADLAETHEPIVLGAEADFRADVPHLHPKLHLVVLHISYRHDEVVYPQSLALHDQLRLNQGVIRVQT